MSCKIYLLRHGIAGPTPAGMSDGDRHLTPGGARKMHRMALGLRRLGIVPDVVLSSPLHRAEETAAAVVAVLAPESAVEIYPPLAPGNAVTDVLTGLRQYRRAHHLMLVGHQPDLGHLASHLLTGSASLLPFPFKKGSIAAIEVTGLPPRSAGILKWFATPRQMAAIGRRAR
ncbi:MAG: phosphohistidine phosphatase SixA [Candidatus Binatia bacterium]